MFELSRRDNLLDLVSNQVNPATKRALRLSTFDGVHCLQQDLCEKAHTELREINKHKPYSSGKKFNKTNNTPYKQPYRNDYTPRRTPHYPPRKRTRFNPDFNQQAPQQNHQQGQRAGNRGQQGQAPAYQPRTDFKKTRFQRK